MAQLGEEGQSGFIPYQRISHIWTMDPSGAIIPGKHDIFSSESPKLMLVLWPLSWRRRKLPQEKNVIAPGGKCHWKEKYQHYSFGERLQIWHRETEDCSNWTDLDRTGRNSFFQWSLELIGKEKKITVSSSWDCNKCEFCLKTSNALK